MANDIDNLKSSFSILNTAFNNMSSQVSSGGISQSEFDALQADFDALQAQVDAIEIPQGQQVTQDDLTALSDQIDTLSADVLVLSAQVTALNDNLVIAQQDIDALQTEVAALQTTTIPTTTTALTAAQAINVQVTSLLGTSILDLDNTLTTEQSFFITFKYKNTTANSYSNVKFNLIFYSDLVVDDIAVNGFKVNTVSSSSLFWAYAGYASSGYVFLSTPGLNIGANAEGEYMLQVTVKLKGATDKDAYLYPSISVYS